MIKNLQDKLDKFFISNGYLTRLKIKRVKTPLKMALHIKRWREKNPLKNKAHKIVYTEIRAKRLVRQPCEVCGKLRSEAHHSDYTKPLDIKWLCKEHHVDEHKRINASL